MQYDFHYLKYFTFLKNLNSSSLSLKLIQTYYLLCSPPCPKADAYDLKSDSVCWCMHKTYPFHIYLTNCTASDNRNMSMVQMSNPSECICVCVSECACRYHQGTVSKASSRGTFTGGSGKTPNVKAAATLMATFLFSQVKLNSFSLYMLPY